MASLRQALSSHTTTVLVDTTLREGDFAITGPGLFGKTSITSPAVTQQILASPEFDQLLSSDKATRIIVLAHASLPR
jgi:hypothetical protein